MSAWWILLGIIILLVLFVTGMYNGLVKLKNRVKNGLANIETQLQRRYDLIPNLIETVKGYAAHEKNVLEQVTLARTSMNSAGTVKEKAAADDALSGTLRTLFAVSENYPQLKADTNFRELQVELTNTENKISFARQFYNDAVTKFNTDIELFPKNIIAGMFGFKQTELFEVLDKASKAAPKVEF